MKDNWVKLSDEEKEQRKIKCKIGLNKPEVIERNKANNRKHWYNMSDEDYTNYCNKRKELYKERKETLPKRCWVNKDGKNKSILLIELENYLSDNYVRGTVNMFTEESRRKILEKVKISRQIKRNLINNGKITKCVPVCEVINYMSSENSELKMGRCKTITSQDELS